MILKQRNLLTTQIFEITDKSLKFQHKRPLHFFENEYSFEEVGTKVIYQKKPYLPGVIASFFSFLLALILFFSYLNDSRDTPLYSVLICIGIFILLLIITYLKQENLAKLFLTNGFPITFYGNSPSETDVSAFLKVFFAEQKRYLINRYAKADPYLSVEQVSNNLKWLWDRKIIEDEELSELRIKLLPKPAGNDAVGFKIN